MPERFSRCGVQVDQHELESKFVPADPNDPEAEVSLAAMRCRRPFEPDEVLASERVDILERKTIIEDVKGDPIGMGVGRRTSSRGAS